jgi:hypothetical protein
MSTRVKDGGEFFGTSAPKHNCSVHENVDFVVIQMHLPFCFWSDAKQSSVSGRYGCRRRPQCRKDFALLKKPYGVIMTALMGVHLAVSALCCKRS